MTSERVERRLAAVLAADVVGYSRLMGASEEGTLVRLKAIRKTIVDPAITEHRGRIVKTTGDGVLVEFASAVDAARCAAEVQRLMAQQNSDMPQDFRIEFRIGIHVGDIIIDDNDIFGDGVNIAARLEGIAEPGGLCISDDAQRQIRGKVDLAFDDMGPQTLKNIAEPMRTWRLRVGAASAAAEQAAPGQTKPVSEMPAALALPDKPSIAVLPFQNMSGDAEQEYFADGMAEDIITALSRFKSLFVIARNSSFTYKGKAVDIKQVGRELGVRYVLEGSVRKAGNRVRITGQLIDATTDRHLWADKFDGALEDVFGLQDQVTASVVGLIAPTLEQAEIERMRQKPTDRLDSYDFFLRGMASLNKMSSLSEARAFFKKASEQDPEYGAAYAMASATLMMQQGVRGVPLTAEMRADATRLADIGSRLGSDDAFALAISGHVLTYIGHEYDRGASMVEQAVALNPNLAVAWYSRGWVTLMCGEAERAIESFDRMIRLSPLDRLRTSAWNGSSFALYKLGRYDEGCAVAMKSIQLARNAHTLGAFAVNAIRAGRAAEARQTVAELLKLQPGFRTSHVREAFPVRDLGEREKIAAAFREAGLPD
ncbi:MAG TPA: adenylate/guanylate cyclase domain-containing protein [Bradyrhizobium sp.]